MRYKGMCIAGITLNFQLQVLARKFGTHVSDYRGNVLYKPGTRMANKILESFLTWLPQLNLL